jgi:transcriptional regulator with XRE-family HTH domain
VAAKARSHEHEALGNAIRQIREREGLTQSQLGRKTGLHPSYISDIERGVRNPSWSIIVNVAKALGIKPSELVAQAE